MGLFNRSKVDNTPKSLSHDFYLLLQEENKELKKKNRALEDRCRMLAEHLRRYNTIDYPSDRQVEEAENRKAQDLYIEALQTVFEAVKFELAIYDQGKGEILAKTCLENLRSILTDIGKKYNNKFEDLKTSFRNLSAVICADQYLRDKAIKHMKERLEKMEKMWSKK